MKSCYAEDVMLRAFKVSSCRRVKIVYSRVPEQIVHFVVAVDVDGRRIVASSMSDGVITSLGFESTSNTVHEVAVVRDYTYVIVIDHWLEGPVITVSKEEAFNMLVRAFECLGYKIEELKEGPEYRYVIMRRD